MFFCTIAYFLKFIYWLVEPKRLENLPFGGK